MKHHKHLDHISAVLLLIGGLCWGLVGAFNFDLIGTIFNGDNDMMSPIARLIYVLIGLSAIYKIIMWAKSRK